MSTFGQPENDEQVSLLTVGPFGGLDSTTSPYYVSPNNYPDMLNFTPNDVYGGYTSALGRASRGSLPSEPNGIFKFERDGLADTYLFAVDVSGVGALYYGPLNGPYNALTLPNPLTAGQQTYFVAAQRWVFVTNGVDTPIKIDQNLVVTNWGIAEPSVAPTLTASGSSTMTGIFYYAVTFGTNNIQESSQGAIAGPISVTGSGVQLTNIQTSGDPQVTERNIYRLGGGLGTWQLVGTLHDNTTTTYLDTLDPAQVTGQILVIHRDPPPPFKFIASHQERIWGWGTPDDHSIVYFSNLNEPWGFNNSTGTLPVGENSFADDAAGISSNGSVLVLNKAKTLYQVYGSTDSQFQAVKVSDTGCLSGKSVATEDGITCWANRRGVWMTQGQGAQMLSDGEFQKSNIKNLWRSLSISDIQASVGFWYDRMYHISLPTINKTLFFDLRSQAWYVLGWACRQVFTDAEADVSVLADNQQAPGQIVQWFAAPTDLGQPIEAYIVSRVSDCGDSSSDKLAMKAEILAPPQTGLCFVYVTANPGNQQYARNYQINLGLGTSRHQISLDNTLRGVEIQLKLQTYSTTQLTIQKATIYGQVDRKLIEQPNAGT